MLTVQNLGIPHHALFFKNTYCFSQHPPRFIQLAKHKREFQEAFDNAQALTRRLSYHICVVIMLKRFVSISVKDVSLLLECWLLLADTLSKTRSPALALPYVMAYVEHCEQHHLPTHSARLVLAHLQVCVAPPVHT